MEGKTQILFKNIIIKYGVIIIHSISKPLIKLPILKIFDQLYLVFDVRIGNKYVINDTNPVKYVSKKKNVKLHKDENEIKNMNYKLNIKIIIKVISR